MCARHANGVSAGLDHLTYRLVAFSKERRDPRFYSIAERDIASYMHMRVPNRQVGLVMFDEVSD